MLPIDPVAAKLRMELSSDVRTAFAITIHLIAGMIEQPVAFGRWMALGGCEPHLDTPLMYHTEGGGLFGPSVKVDHACIDEAGL